MRGFFTRFFLSEIISIFSHVLPAHASGHALIMALHCVLSLPAKMLERGVSAHARLLYAFLFIRNHFLIYTPCLRI